MREWGKLDFGDVTVWFSYDVTGYMFTATHILDPHFAMFEALGTRNPVNDVSEKIYIYEKISYIKNKNHINFCK